MAKTVKKKTPNRRTTGKQGINRLAVIIFLSSVVLLFGIGVFVLQSLSSRCANSISCISDLSGAYDIRETTGVFLGKAVSVPAEEPSYPPVENVLGDSTVEKRIEVDLTNQRLYAYEGDTRVFDFLISSGKYGRTPTGDFRIWIKLKSTKMSGGSKALGTYYYLPNVPYTMYFYNAQVPKHRGFGIHGAYWHNNFGHPMSHGCINMRREDVEQLYNWAHPVSTKHTNYATPEDPGTLIRIYGTAPKS